MSFFRDEQLSNESLTVKVIATSNKRNQESQVTIFKEILKEEVNFSVTNEFSTGKDPLSRLLGSVFEGVKGLAPIADTSAKSIGESMQGLGEFFNNKELASLGKNMEKGIRSAMNSDLVSTTELLRIFDSSNITIPVNVGGWIYHDDIDFDNSRVRRTVKEKIDIILSRTVGDLKSFGDFFADSPGADTAKNNTTTSGASSDDTSTLNKLISFQTSPNGYTVEYKNIGEAIKGRKDFSELLDGTFTVNYGDLLLFKNMVPTSVNITPSKQKVRGTTNDFLYAKVDMSFESAVKWVPNNLRSSLKLD